MSLPVALDFPEKDPAQGWGRLLDLSPTGARLETRWPLKAGQTVYLTLNPRREIRLENLRSRVVHVDWEEGYYVAGLLFDESVDQGYLKEVLVMLMTGSNP